MPNRKKILVYADELDENAYPEECPFDSSRAGLMRRTARDMGLLSGNDRSEVAPVPLNRKELERFHHPEYLDALELGGKGEIHPDMALKAGLGTPDSPIFKGMYDHACLAAGGTLTGARKILGGQADAVFNPSGGFHHAAPQNAAGFCYLNDIVLAAMEFMDHGKRVLFLDVDVHHCEAVQDAFYGQSGVMVISLHESGASLFPGTGFEGEIGTGAGTGYTVNFPLPVGTYDGAYERVFREGALPLIERFDPDVIMLEIGMDGLAGDPLAHLHLTNNVYAGITETVVKLGKPVLATGGGGYQREHAVRGWVLCWGILCGDEAGMDDLTMGLGGVMLENVDWLGGLRDRVLLADAGRRDTVDTEINRVLQEVRTRVFPLHGLE